MRYLSVADKLAYLFKLNALCVYTTCVYFLYEYLFSKAKILLNFFYMVGIRKLEVMGPITW